MFQERLVHNSILRKDEPPVIIFNRDERKYAHEVGSGQEVQEGLHHLWNPDQEQQQRQEESDQLQWPT